MVGPPSNRKCAHARKTGHFIMLLQSMVLLVMGFGFVFAFLFAMIAAVSLTTKFLNRFCPSAPISTPRPVVKTLPKPQPTTASPDEKIAVAAAATFAQRLDPDSLTGITADELVALAAASLRQRAA